MLKSLCIPEQKSLDDFKRMPPIYNQFEALISKFQSKYGFEKKPDCQSLFEFTYELQHGNQRLRNMSFVGFSRAYRIYSKIKQKEAIR
ncbi:hypothetical protein [Ferroplasma acidarmanus]|uniref:Uncharacterized protein n=1 Tax=Ferroplasma acidarmanus Fer1 TaxID=333146 RepID=S0ARJ3_FERAC|nr:hypothetical protein [Ferroplasma acidarmanus]AGO61407.1 hypothetical protein FACI_IFERC00001G1427 [Ferroplasma acidarmanus Fer1]